MFNYTKFLLILTVSLLFYPTIATANDGNTTAKNDCKIITNYTNKNDSSNSVDVLNKQNSDTRDTAVITDKNIVVAGINVPSLWWARQQFDPFGGRLISNWFTYPQLKQIDLTVNWQLWTLLDYLGRYRFINQFGTVAREHGYNLRIFNQQQQCLAIYQYNDRVNPPKWEIKLEGIGEDSLQIESN